MAIAVFALSCKHKHAPKNIRKGIVQHTQSPPLVKSEKYIKQPGDSTFWLIELIEYDAKGRKIKSTTFSRPDTVDYTQLFSYAGDDTLPSVVNTVYALTGDTLHEEHRYNSDNRVISTKWKNSNKAYGDNEYEYDNENHLTKWMQNVKGRLLVQRDYPTAYDKDHNLVWSGYKESDGNEKAPLLNEWRYSYDSSGNELMKISTDQGDVSEIIKSVYDSLGNKTAELTYQKDTSNSQSLTLVSRSFMIYNKFGDMVTRQVFDKSGQLLEEVKLEYDEYGHVLNEETKLSSGENTSVRYKYFYKNQ